MNKLATILGYAVALTAWAAPLEGTSADTISVPVVNMVGTWTGIADAVSKAGYFHDVAVTLDVKDQQTMKNASAHTNSANTFFRGTITFSPPYGSGKALPFFSKLESGQPMNGGTQQTLHGMWAGQGFVGCGMGMAMTMNDMNMATLMGCMHFTGQDGDSPSMAFLDLTKN
ncbi:MAG: hypothetical protein ACLPXB_03170 [Thiobacillaceae bacterium]